MARPPRMPRDDGRYHCLGCDEWKLPTEYPRFAGTERPRGRCYLCRRAAQKAYYHKQQDIKTWGADLDWEGLTTDVTTE